MACRRLFPQPPEMAGEEAGVPGAETKLRPKLADVAEQAGVSAATASRVLTGSARVRPETRQQVEAAIASLGFERTPAPRLRAQPGASVVRCPGDRVRRVHGVRGQRPGVLRALLPADAAQRQPG